MADPALVATIVETGIPAEDAADMIDRVTTAMLHRLQTGKQVRVDGIGTLRAPTKVANCGYPPATLRQQRKIELRHGAIVEQGEPYPDPRGPRKRTSTYGG